MMRCFLMCIAMLGSTVWFSACGDDDDDNYGDANFPDANFRSYVMENFDTDGDGIISLDEANAVTQIACQNKHITSLVGIEMFGALTELNCSSNLLMALDVSNNTELTTLWCYNNLLTTLDISKNIALADFSCSYNLLTALDVSRNTELLLLYCAYNKLTTLDVSRNTELVDLVCSDNQLMALDVGNNTELRRLGCSGNQLTALDFSNNTILIDFLVCLDNQLTAPALNALFNTLPTITKENSWYNVSIYIGRNPGTYTCNRKIATNKGWTVYY